MKNMLWMLVACALSAGAQHFIALLKELYQEIENNESK